MESPHQSEYSLLNSMILRMDQCCCTNDNDNDDTHEICGCGKVARVSHLPIHHCPFRRQFRLQRNAECYNNYSSSLTVGMIPLLVVFPFLVKFMEVFFHN